MKPIVLDMKRFSFFLLFALICLIGFKSFSQNTFNTFGETTLSLGHDISKSYHLNFVFRSRYFLYNQNNILYKQQQLDVFHFSTFKLSKRYKLSLGGYFRTRDWFDSGKNELRFLEQISYISQKENAKYNHRFRTEQRCIDNQIIFRERYKFSVGFPINKKTIGSKKTYLTSSVEGLVSLSKNEKTETDVRLSTQIGWQIKDGIKLQTGVEHRLEAFNLEAKNNLFILTSAILKI